MRPFSAPRHVRKIVGVACVGWLVAAGARAQVPAADSTTTAQVDKVFERWTRPGSPGCAVGVSRDGASTLTRAYGLANLEFGVPLTPTSIFESGSVAKQFTAAAIGLLVLDGKLAVTDSARKYVPELPAFASGITIQHLLTHTSGLRSQWPLLSLAGRPPTEAVHTVDEILDLVSRQQRLNFAPGDYYLYNNTAFTLLGVIVSRVSGQSLQAFSEERLFRPLGMTSTRWRENHRQVVPGRATAYRQVRDGTFETHMSITNVIGNGGLLTTVDDLLRWNANLDAPGKVGGRALVDWLETRGRLNDGFENEYARGLTVTSYKGLREVSHGGSTAGYQTFLARFPEARLSVAVLCNTTGTNPGAMAHQVADVFLAGRLKPEPARPTVTVADDVLRSRAGWYANPVSGALIPIVMAKDGLRANGPSGPKLEPIAPNEFASGRTTFRFESGATNGTTVGRVIETPGNTRPTTWVRVEPFTPTAEALKEYEGRFTSSELEVTYRVYEREGTLWLRLHGEPPDELRPADRDRFESDGNVVRFTRDGTGRVDGFTVYAGRVWHLRFDREKR